MENLKAIIVFLLFWSIAIWCVRVVKRKHKKQIMKFSEELPECRHYMAIVEKGSMKWL